MYEQYDWFFTQLQDILETIDKCKYFNQSKSINFIEDDIAIDIADDLLNNRQEFESFYNTDEQWQIEYTNPMIKLIKGNLQGFSMSSLINSLEDIIKRCLAYTNVIQEMNTINPNKTIKYYSSSKDSPLTFKEQIKFHPLSFTSNIKRTNKGRTKRKHKTQRTKKSYGNNNNDARYMESLYVKTKDISDLNEITGHIINMLCYSNNNKIPWLQINELIDVTLKNVDVNLPFSEVSNKEIKELESCMYNVKFPDYESEAQLKLFLHLISK